MSNSKKHHNEQYFDRSTCVFSRADLGHTIRMAHHIYAITNGIKHGAQSGAACIALALRAC